MSREIFNQRAVAFIGGLTDNQEILPLRAEPLSSEHRIFYLYSNCDDKTEQPADKIARIREELRKLTEDNGEMDVVGISFGGTLGLCAGHDLGGIRGIITAASPLRNPDKMTWSLKIVDRMFPAIRGVIETFVEKVQPVLSPERTAQLLNLRGTRDGKVPPAMSIVDGAVNHQLRTPAHIVATHSYNIKNALGLPVVKDFIAQTRTKPA